MRTEIYLGKYNICNIYMYVYIHISVGNAGVVNKQKWINRYGK